MTPKLTDAFNKNADKIIDVVAMDQAVYDTLGERLDEAELDAFMFAASRATPMAANVPAGTKLYIGNNSDGDQSAFIQVSALAAAFTKNAGIYGDVQEKVENIFADVLNSAADYKADVTAGKLKGIPMPKQ